MVAKTVGPSDGEIDRTENGDDGGGDGADGGLTQPSVVTTETARPAMTARVREPLRNVNAPRVSNDLKLPAQRRAVSVAVPAL